MDLTKVIMTFLMLFGSFILIPTGLGFVVGRVFEQSKQTTLLIAGVFGLFGVWLIRSWITKPNDKPIKIA
jgi:nitrate/nitrite transporter NarK